MAYTPVNWQTGDTITAEKLNKMDRGWGYVTSSPTELFSETVTTADSNGDNIADLSYSQRIDADTITVTFDGTVYTCPRINADGAYVYGGFNNSPDFTEYPFFIWSDSKVNQLITQTAGEHTIAVTAAVTAMQISADFSAAVSMASPIDASTLPFRCVEDVTTLNEANKALEDGRLVYFTANDETYEATPKCFMVNAVGVTCTIVPTSTKIEAKFSRDGLFHIKHLSS